MEAGIYDIRMIAYTRKHFFPFFFDCQLCLLFMFSSSIAYEGLNILVRAICQEAKSY